jgi:hypothetical protein
VESAPSSRETESTLARRLARLSLVRLTVLTVFLALVSLVYLRGVTDGYSSQVAFSTVVAGYALAAVYASLLRLQRFLGAVGYAQIVTDQLLWTVIVFLTGGVGSGAVSLYGLTVVAAAIVLGVRGAVFAWIVGAAVYLGMTTLLVEGLLLPPPDQDPAVFATSWRSASAPPGATCFAPRRAQRLPSASRGSAASPRGSLTRSGTLSGASPARSSSSARALTSPKKTGSSVTSFSVRPRG